MGIFWLKIVDLWGVVPRTKIRISHRLAVICIFMLKFMIYVYSLNFPLWLVLERFPVFIPTQNGRFMGGRSPNKKSYLAPFSIYSHIYDFMHILIIFQLVDVRDMKYLLFDAE